jgi:hypothetical protein
MHSSGSVRYRRKAAAVYLNEEYGIPCSEKTLAKLACIGGGPAYHKAGRFPLYPQGCLDAWAVAKLGPLLRSTSEADAGLSETATLAASGSGEAV